MKFQLCMMDEYGSVSIHASGDLDKMINIGKGKVQSANVDNPLTSAEKKRLWEECFPLFPTSSKKNIRYIYGGKDGSGRHIAYALDRNNAETCEKMQIGEVETHIDLYLGELDGESWSVTSENGGSVTSLDHPILRNKTLWFIHKV